ncbi:helix-turn-helix transcriptional regulator [Nocardia gipuzkoensis]|uniref:helix-turn-helix transcriptional regulator n=1 Tax=Nocardia gipuzkoensis TaxID=2749991 RepID=UPI003EDEA387
MAMTVERFSGIVARIDHAALHPADWPQAVHDIGTALGAHRGVLVVSGGGCRRMTACSIGADDLRRSYNARFWRIDPIASVLEHAPAGVIMTCDELLEPEYLHRHPFFRDWMFPHRLGNGMLALITSGPRTSSWIGLYPDSSRDLDRTEAKSGMRLLLPHLRQAVTVHSRLADARSERDRATAVLDLQWHGLVIVVSCGAVSYANPVALSILESRDGLGIGRRGHLESSDRRAAAELRAMIDSAVREHGLYVGGRMLIPRRSGGSSYAVRVLPLDPAFDCLGERPSAALVVIVDPDRETPEGPEALRQLYGLTAAEAHVAAAALRGEGLRPIAEELAVSVNTARTHLQHVFHKTGTHRQAELVRVLTTVLAGTGQLEGTAGRGMSGAGHALLPESSPPGVTGEVDNVDRLVETRGNELPLGG